MYDIDVVLRTMCPQESTLLLYSSSGVIADRQLLTLGLDIFPSSPCGKDEVFVCVSISLCESTVPGLVHHTLQVRSPCIDELLLCREGHVVTLRDGTTTQK